MREADGKGPRVTGFFIFLIGAGIILDSGAHGLGGVVALSGAALLVWGFFQSGSGRGATVVGTPAESS